MSGLKKWSTFLNEAKNKRKTLTSIICVNEDDKVLVIKRSPDEGSKQGYWDLPGGHVDDEDKSIEKGALRELEEETGLKSSEEDLKYVQKIESNDADRYFYVTTGWSGKVKFTPNPKTGVIEHTDAKWKTIDEIKSEKSLQQRTFPAYLLSKALDKAKKD